MKRMNSRERILAAIAKEQVDQIPLGPPFQGYWALGIAGLPVIDSIKHPRRAAAAQVEVTKRCQFDGIETMWDWLTAVEALGCEVKIPEIGTIPTWTSVVKDDDTLAKLSHPDPKKDYRTKSAMETTAILRPMLEKEKFLYMTMVSPFTLAGELRGVEAMMLDTLMEPDFVLRLLRFSSSVVKEYVEHLVTAGVDGVILCDPTASGSLISKEDFSKYSQPFMKECGAVVTDADQHLLIHICGDTSDRLDTVVDVGADIFSLDYQVDLKVAHDAVGDRQTLLGNVKPAHTLFSGTPDAVMQESLECIAKTGGKGFILGAGCDIAPGTPIENVDVWKSAVKAR